MTGIEKEQAIYPLPAKDMKSLLLEYFEGLDKLYQPVFLNLIRSERTKENWVIVPATGEKELENGTHYLIRIEDAYEWLREEFF